MGWELIRTVRGVTGYKRNGEVLQTLTLYQEIIIFLRLIEKLSLIICMLQIDSSDN